MADDRLLDLLADGVDGVEGEHRLLEDHGDGASTQRGGLGFAEPAHVQARHADLALDAGAAPGQETHQRPERHALAGAGLSEDPEDLARDQVEAHAVDSVDGALPGGEAHAEVANRDDGRRLRRRRGRHRDSRAPPTGARLCPVSGASM